MVQTALRTDRAKPLAPVCVAEDIVAQQLAGSEAPFDPAQQVDSFSFFDSTMTLPELMDTEPIFEAEPIVQSEEAPVEVQDTPHSQDPFDVPLFGENHSEALHSSDLSSTISSASAANGADEFSDRQEQYTNVESEDAIPGFAEPDLVPGSSDKRAAEDGISPPAWNYTENHWPMLVGHSDRKSFSRVRTSMVALTLIGCAAAFYFVIYRPATQGQSMAATTSAQTQAPATGSHSSTPDVVPASARNLESAKTSGENSAASATEDHSPTATDAVSKGDTVGRFSLQAAAFPTQAGADEFAEKLKRAGVPSYVVSAEVGRRGTWYRVRVGRFESAEAARQYSNEAQLRSKTAGISLQLIVCQYEQQ